MAAGTPFAAAHTFRQTGPFRPANLHPSLANVVFTGSGTQPGVGVPMVLISGKLRRRHGSRRDRPRGAPRRAGRRVRRGRSARPPSRRRTGRRASCTGPSRCSCATPPGGCCCSSGPRSRRASRCAGPTPAAGTRGPGEDLGVAAPRRLVEELGLDGVALTEVGVYAYHAEDPATGRVEYEYDHVLLGDLPAGGAPRPTPPRWPTCAGCRCAALLAELAADPTRVRALAGGVTACWPSTSPSAADASRCIRRSRFDAAGAVGWPMTALTAGAVARRLGVAVTTLRTWHQRYGLGPSRHVPGQHRRYTAQDLDRLQVMRRLTAQGVAPAEAAAWARRFRCPRRVPARPTRTGPQPRRRRARHRRRSGRRRPPAGWPAPRCGWTRRPCGTSSRWWSPSAASSATWNDVAVPVLIGIGERYQATRRFVEVEHLISRSVTEVLGSVPRAAGAVCPGCCSPRPTRSSTRCPGGAGRGAGRGRGADPAARRPGARRRRSPTRSPVPARTSWCSGRSAPAPATRRS